MLKIWRVYQFSSHHESNSIHYKIYVGFVYLIAIAIERLFRLLISDCIQCTSDLAIETKHIHFVKIWLKRALYMKFQLIIGLPLIY